MSKTFKPRVVFTFVEAGLGHIIPMNGLYERFVEKYGDKCEVIKSYIFSESKQKSVQKLAKTHAEHVKRLSESKIYNICELISYKFSSRFTLWLLDRAFQRARKDIMKDYHELNPDLMVSSYYLPSHIAVEANKKNITDTLIATYVPDTYVYPAWDRNCDLLLVNNDEAYNMAVSTGYDQEKVEKIPFIYRNDIEQYAKTKAQAKEKLNLNNGKFTLLCAMGGYGVKKAKKVIKEILKANLDINFTVLCGTNEKMLKYINKYQKKYVDKTNFKACGYTEDIATYIKAADLVIGKASMNTTMEICYLGTPLVVFSEAGGAEINNIKNFTNQNIVIKEHNIQNIINLIKQGMRDKARFNAQVESFERFRVQGGSDQGAEKLFELLKKRYPEMNEQKISS